MVAAGLLVQACAAAPWQHPGLPEDRWRQDEAACKRWAAAEVEKEVARDRAAGGDPTMRRDDAFGANMARLQAAKRQRAFVAQCMRARGYERLKTGDKSMASPPVPRIG